MTIEALTDPGFGPVRLRSSRGQLQADVHGVTVRVHARDHGVEAVARLAVETPMRPDGSGVDRDEVAACLQGVADECPRLAHVRLNRGAVEAVTVAAQDATAATLATAVVDAALLARVAVGRLDGLGARLHEAQVTAQLLARNEAARRRRASAGSGRAR